MNQSSECYENLTAILKKVVLEKLCRNFAKKTNFSPKRHEFFSRFVKAGPPAIGKNLHRNNNNRYICADELLESRQNSTVKHAGIAAIEWLMEFSFNPKSRIHYMFSDFSIMYSFNNRHIILNWFSHWMPIDEIMMARLNMTLGHSSNTRTYTSPFNQTFELLADHISVRVRVWQCFQLKTKNMGAVIKFICADG